MPVSSCPFNTSTSAWGNGTMRYFRPFPSCTVRTFISKFKSCTRSGRHRLANSANTPESAGARQSVRSAPPHRKARSRDVPVAAGSQTAVWYGASRQTAEDFCGHLAPRHICDKNTSSSAFISGITGAVALGCLVAPAGSHRCGSTRRGGSAVMRSRLVFLGAMG